MSIDTASQMTLDDMADEFADGSGSSEDLITRVLCFHSETRFPHVELGEIDCSLALSEMLSDMMVAANKAGVDFDDALREARKRGIAGRMMPAPKTIQ
jgi:hypothetical protein